MRHCCRMMKANGARRVKRSKFADRVHQMNVPSRHDHLRSARRPADRTASRRLRPALRMLQHQTLNEALRPRRLQRGIGARPTIASSSPCVLAAKTGRAPIICVN